MLSFVCVFFRRVAPPMALLLNLAFAASAQPAEISGAVVAAPGSSSVSGTLVELCPMRSGANQADCGTGPAVTLQSNSAIGYFRFTDVGSGTYRIVAHRDVNRTGDWDAGDEAAVYSRYPNQEPADVQSGATNIAMRLIPYAGDVNVLFEGRRRDGVTMTGTIPATASVLQRRWGGTGPIADNYNASTGAFVGTTWSANGIEFRANGTYESADMYQQTNSCNVYIDRGRYKVTGGTIRLTPSALLQHACGSSKVSTRPGSKTVADYYWRMQYYAGQSLSLEIIAKAQFRDERDWFYAKSYLATAP